MFDEEFLEGLPSDPDKAAVIIIDTLMEFHKELSRDDEIKNYAEYVQAVNILRAFAETQGIKLNSLVLGNNLNENIQNILIFFNTARGTLAHNLSKDNFAKFKAAMDRKFGKSFSFRFSDGDIKRIQALLNELRDIIIATESLEEDHKSRLINRLEKLQAELHKSVSDLDRFWGLLVDGSIVLKKIGENAKPIVDRIQEIVNIVWRVQARAEELPSNAPLALPGSDENKAE